MAQGDTPPPAPDDADNGDAADGAALPLLAVLTKPVVVAIAFGLLLIGLLALVVGVFSPERLANPLARFSYCFLVAFGISFFLFVAYPFVFRLGKFPGLEIVAGIVGPAALFIAFLSVFLAWMPSASTWQFVVPQRAGKPLKVDASAARLTSPEDFRIRAVRDGDGFVEGYFVLFEDQTEFKGDFSDSNDVYPVQFDRDATTFDIRPVGSGSGN